MIILIMDQEANKSRYQLTVESKHMTDFARLINEYEDIVAVLNGTDAEFNRTVLPQEIAPWKTNGKEHQLL